MLPQHFSIQGWETTPTLWHLILRQELSQHLKLQRMMTECVQNEQDENDDQAASQDHHRSGDELSMRMVHSAYAEKLVKLDVGLGWGWSMSQHGVGTGLG